MKIVVKTLKRTRFEIEVEPKDSVSEVKKNIETVLGASAYPAAEQVLIHKGKVLKDETTMEDNNISEKSSVAIMISKFMPETQKPAAELPQTQRPARQDSEAEILNKELTEGEDGGNELAQPEDGLQLLVDAAVESKAIERLEAMGFERSVVLEAFFACNKNEQLAANYLLDHINEPQ